MAKNRYGATRTLVLPETEWPELTEKAEEYQRLATERRLTIQRLEALRDDRAKAERADRKAHAEAVRAGKDDPGTPKVDAVDDKIAATRRRLEAVTEAQGQVERELSVLVEERRDEWQADADEKVAKAYDRYAKKVEQLEAARQELDRARSLSGWVSAFPERQTFRVAPAPVLGLASRSGEPFGWPQVLSALQSDARPPQQQERVAHVPHAQQVWPATGVRRA